MKIHISYETEAQKEEVMKLLRPVLIGARVKIKKDTQAQRKHIYITK